ncbi:uncharacterized protein [Phaseolus vulgaris]|uniref:uncharacterized protein n=1 Tax=Phaseolus vulgaris TaxID=3885 RepID=UPI0035CBB770
MEVSLPNNWKNLTLEKYDGSTDPDEHVTVYITQINLYTSEDAILCRVFLKMFKGAKLSWFAKLPPYSIDCFDTLVMKFEAHFATSKPHHLTSITLVNIRQKKEESLRAFMEKFGRVALSIRNLSPKMTMHHMVTTLKPRLFVDSLCKQPTTDLVELRQRATKFMQLEELKSFKSQIRAIEGVERREKDGGRWRKPKDVYKGP